MPFGAKKIRMVWLPDGENSEDMYNCVDRIPACDRRDLDRRETGDGQKGNGRKKYGNKKPS